MRQSDKAGASRRDRKFDVRWKVENAARLLYLLAVRAAFCQRIARMRA